MESACCENCAFSRRNPREYLECRRHAAVCTHIAGYADGFPQVAATEWCGEFQHEAAGSTLVRPDPLDSVRVWQLTRCFARLAVVADEQRHTFADPRLEDVLADVAKIIDLPVAVEALKKEPA